jgi:hypothetical protein
LIIAVANAALLLVLIFEIPAWRTSVSHSMPVGSISLAEMYGNTAPDHKH